MKKLIIKSFVVIAFLLPTMLSAQTAIDNLYEKYAGQKGFTSINISPEMFGMLSALDMDDSSSDVKDAQNVMHQLKGLKMLVFEPEDGQTSKFVKEVKKMMLSKDYSELMSVDSEDAKIKFLVKKAKDGTVLELLMIVAEDTEALVMSMTGNLDMKTISEISKSLDVDGLENLDKLNEK
jgi:hypothetical protein